ncbi:MAG: hypothetical protein SF029_04715 [bacterium]|nr:hypothetical protein [bacterium]
MANDKQYKTEWSFSFEKIGDKFGEQFGKMGERFNTMFDSIATDEEVKSATYAAGLSGATSALVELDLSIGRTTVQVGTNDAANFFEADLKYVGEINFTVSGETEKVVRLRQKSDNQIGQAVKRAFKTVTRNADLRWDVRLSPSVPLKLNIEGGVGPAVVDLNGLQLTRLTMEGGVGETTVNLPEGTYPVSVEGGVGAMHLTIPDNAALRLNIEGGVGATRITVPYKAAVRITVDGNLGGVKMPEHFVRVKEGNDFVGNSGVWETPGFNMAEKQVVIDFEGGVGSLTVRTDVTNV